MKARYVALYREGFQPSRRWELTGTRLTSLCVQAGCYGSGVEILEPQARWVLSQFCWMTLVTFSCAILSFLTGKMRTIISSVWMSHCEHPHENSVRLRQGIRLTRASQSSVHAALFLLGTFPALRSCCNWWRLGFTLCGKRKPGTDYMWTASCVSAKP